VAALLGESICNKSDADLNNFDAEDMDSLGSNKHAVMVSSPTQNMNICVHFLSFQAQ
jgi:hypothetical protein